MTVSPLSSLAADTYSYIHRSKRELLETLHRQPHLSEIFDPETTTMFDRFYNYIADAVYTGDLTNLRAEFYDVGFCVLLCNLLSTVV